MDYSHRTVIRHLAVAAALLSLPFFLGPSGEAWVWLKEHALYFGLVLACATLVGLGADLLVRRHILARWILILAGQAPAALTDLTSDPGALQSHAKKLGYSARLFLLWGSCSRCVAYWISGALTALTFYWIWPYGDSDWSYLLVLLYFSMLAASLAAGLVVILYLLRLRQSNSPRDSTQ